jgi:dolichyl-diphosphooligosaccharide--protein glycosyltransferase
VDPIIGDNKGHPPIAGALVTLPTYFLAKRFADRPAALAGAVTLTLLGTFFRYSLVDFPDHSIAEVLFQSTAVLAFLVAFGVAEREKPSGSSSVATGPS